MAVDRDDAKGLLRVLIEGKEAFAFHYGDDLDLPYVLPQPLGQGPHHRADGPLPAPPVPVVCRHRATGGAAPASFYNAFYSRADKKDPDSPFQDRIRLVAMDPARIEGAEATVEARLLWEMDRKTAVLDEARRMRVVALGAGSTCWTSRLR